MRKSFFIILTITIMGLMAGMVTSCGTGEDNAWGKYEDWRNDNMAWFKKMRDSVTPEGDLYYKVLYPQWNPQAEILIHYFNDREKTKGNLQPMLTSTCDVIYYGRLYDGTPFDSSYVQTQYGKAIARFTPQTILTGNGVAGFAIAMMDMHVGDSCEVVIPYALAYGKRQTSIIKPYSTLRFNIGLKDIPYYEIRDPK